MILTPFFTEIGIFGIFMVLFFLCFSFYLLPFMGPSTMILAGALAIMYPNYPPITLALVVASSASIAKTVIYYISFFLGKKLLKRKTFDRLQNYGKAIGKWTWAAIFIASATPIPDEPVLIAASLIRYDPIRFFAWFLIGKLIVTIPAAYVGKTLISEFGDMVGYVPMTIASILVTVIITVIMLRVDLPFGKTNTKG